MELKSLTLLMLLAVTTAATTGEFNNEAYICHLTKIMNVPRRRVEKSHEGGSGSGQGSDRAGSWRQCQERRFGKISLMFFSFIQLTLRSTKWGFEFEAEIYSAIRAFKYLLRNRLLTVTRTIIFSGFHSHLLGCVHGRHGRREIVGGKRGGRHGNYEAALHGADGAVPQSGKLFEWGTGCKICVKIV